MGKGVLVRQGDRWASTAAYDAADVPATLHGLLLSRVDRLPAEARRALQEAAVLGAEFDGALLREVTADAAAAPGALDRLVEADLIRAAGAGRDGARYRFTHALAHEVVYQNLLLTRRTELHETAARALERAAGPHPERLSDLEALGHHWSLSADKPRGARYLLAAGDWARAVYANADAIRHYERALHTLAQCPACDVETWAARERLADLLGLTGRRAEALAHYESVKQATESSGDRAAGARLQRKIGGLHWEAGDRERAAACFASGLERLGTDGDPLERAHLFQEMGRLAFRAGDNAGAIEWAERALAQAATEEGYGDRSRAGARGRRHASAGLQHPGRGAREDGTSHRSGRADRAEHRAGRGARSVAGRLPRVYESWSALQLARPAPQHRDVPPGARDRQEGGRSRLPVAALRESRGGVLRA